MFLSCFAAAQIFATACRFASAVFLPDAQIVASAHLFVAVSFAAAAAAAFVLWIEASQTQRHVTVDGSKFESPSSSSFRMFVYSHFSFVVSAFADCVFELLSANAFTCPFVVSLVFVFLCFCVDVTTRSLPFVPASLSHLTTDCSQSLRRVFCQPFSTCSSTSDSMSWYL